MAIKFPGYELTQPLKVAAPTTTSTTSTGGGGSWSTTGLKATAPTAYASTNTIAPKYVAPAPTTSSTSTNPYQMTSAEASGGQAGITAYNQRIASMRSPAPTAPTQTSTAPTATQNTGLYGQLINDLRTRSTQPQADYTAAQQRLTSLGSTPNPDVKASRDALLNFQTAYATRMGQNQSNPIPLEFQQGRGQVISNQYYMGLPAYQTGVQNALASQGQQINALGQVASAANTQQGIQQQGLLGAAGLARPITGVPYGTQTLDPTTGLPMPGTGGDFNAAMATYAQALASNQGASIPSSITSNPVLMAQLLQMAKGINPGFNYNTATGLGSAQQQSATVLGTAGAQSAASLIQQKNQLQSVFNGVEQTYQLLLDTAKQGGVNATNIPVINSLQQNVARGLTSSSAVANFQSTLATVRQMYAQILGGGTITVDGSQRAAQVIPDNISYGALLSLGEQLKAEAVNRIQGIEQQIQSASGGSSNDPLGIR